jgi:5-methyltetrahydropteroyltriglutamate--homocysteine methyltransferase
MSIPTEPIGSLPRRPELVAAIERLGIDAPELEPLYEEAVRECIEGLERVGSPVVTDGEQRKYHNFWTYPVQGSPKTAPDGFRIPFAAGHTRRMPRLTAGPFRYVRYASRFVECAMRYATVPVKQAVIAPSALSLMYPEGDVPGYERDAFFADLMSEFAKEVRGCFAAGAQTVQVDFTEARLALKLDPSGDLLSSFVDLNNLAFRRLGAADRTRLGVHTCPGGDHDSTHSADVDYADLVPLLFTLEARDFYVSLAGEPDRRRALAIIRDHIRPRQRVFVGVVSPIDPRVETPEEVRDRVLEAAEFVPLHQLGTTDDCGFAPFCDDDSTTRETALAKIRARVLGTELAARELGV